MKEKKNTVSVLMSVYNGEEFIEAQLDSIRLQSCKVDEVIIIDDCSTDNTAILIKKYIVENKLSSTWRLLINETNYGWKHNFISGLNYINSDIVCFSDQDDIWFKNKIEVYKSIFNQNRKVNVIASKETKWDGLTNIKNTAIENERYIKVPFNKKNFFIQCSGCTMAVKMNYVNKIIRFYISDWAHDDFFWKMGLLDETLILLNTSSILHRIHGTNESLKKRNRQTTLQTINLNENIINIMIMRLKFDKSINNREAKLQILLHKKNGNLERKKLFKSKNIMYIFPIFIRYRDLYRRMRQILGDLVYAFGR